MAVGRQSRNQRQSYRVDALLRVKGELVPLGCPITIFNINRTGLAVLSEMRFRPGERLDFCLTGRREPPVRVSAAAVHSQPLRGSPDLYLTGFSFQPGLRTGVVPEAAIRKLIAAVAPAGIRV